MWLQHGTIFSFILSCELCLGSSLPLVLFCCLRCFFFLAQQLKGAWRDTQPNSFYCHFLARRWPRRRPRWSRPWDTASLSEEKWMWRGKGSSPPSLLTQITRLLISDKAFTAGHGPDTSCRCLLFVCSSQARTCMTHSGVFFFSFSTRRNTISVKDLK